MRANQPKIISPTIPSNSIEHLPEEISELESLAIKQVLPKGIFLLDYTNPREYLDVVKALTELIKLPQQLKVKKAPSAVEMLLKKSQK
ncbi:hypothetical protein [Lentimicrobium sp. S6]|uniref:hypothetical protein n=1 Tax=Lentimicrobium sp. S6 TaxID=2735872 RepID=UPI0015569590|nr:hypothetical protein [Lentimicrobium sp. S6]NPD47601.1 hypothetical protein [Lentimicrobium sp. S6]